MQAHSLPQTAQKRKSGKQAPVYTETAPVADPAQAECVARSSSLLCEDRLWASVQGSVASGALKIDQNKLWVTVPVIDHQSFSFDRGRWHSGIESRPYKKTPLMTCLTGGWGLLPIRSKQRQQNQILTNPGRVRENRASESRKSAVSRFWPSAACSNPASGSEPPE